MGGGGGGGVKEIPKEYVREKNRREGHLKKIAYQRINKSYSMYSYIWVGASKRNCDGGRPKRLITVQNNCATTPPVIIFDWFFICKFCFNHKTILIQFLYF